MIKNRITLYSILLTIDQRVRHNELRKIPVAIVYTSDIITNFATNDYVKLYDICDSFKKEYYGIDSLVGGTQVNFPAFKTLFPMMVFDVRKQNEKLRTGVTDTQVK